jgi:hypothetical protein
MEITMLTVPANQAVSFTVYMQAIHHALPVNNNFIAAQMGRIQRAYEAGEPINMIVEEMKLRWEVTRGKWQKTPRQLAKRRE